MSSTRAPEIAQVAPSVWRCALPLTGHALGHVNTYALADAEGVALVDVGWAVDEVRAALGSFLGDIGSSLDEVHTVYLTHVHADHAGLAGEFQRRSGATVVMHAADAEGATARHGPGSAFHETTHRWMMAAGVPQELHEFGRHQVDNERLRFAELDVTAVVDPPGRREGHTIAAVHTPGHTAGHLCFLHARSRLLFSGDTVFERIRYGPTFRPFASPDPLDDYLTSLDRLEGLGVDLVQPGHGGPFGDLPGRLRFLRRHHERQAVEVRKAVSAGATTVWEVASRLPRSQRWERLPPGRRFSATGDAYAQLLRLARSGALAATGDAPVRWTST